MSEHLEALAAARPKIDDLGYNLITLAVKAKGSPQSAYLLPLIGAANDHKQVLIHLYTFYTASNERLQMFDALAHVTLYTGIGYVTELIQNIAAHLTNKEKEN